MKTTIVITNKNFDYLCEGNDCGTIDTGFGHYRFDLDKNKLTMYDGIGLCIVIELSNKIATVYYKDDIDLRAALNIL